MNKLKKPLHATFKFEFGKKWYGRVHIYPTSRQMYKATGTLKNNPKDFAALCRWTRPKFQKSGKLVDLFFNEEDLCVEHIAHETAHACTKWASKVGFDWKKSHSSSDHKKPYHKRHSERWAYAIGIVCEQIVRAYQKKVRIIK